MTDRLSALEMRVLAFIAEGEGDFDELALEVHRFQRENCAPYRAFCAGLPEPVAWRDIPAVPLTAFRQVPIRTFPAAETIRVFRTSGTTGERLGEHFFRTMDLYRAAALGGWAAAGLEDRNVFCLIPPPDEAPHSSLSGMAGWLAPQPGRFFAGAWESVSDELAAARAPVVLFGTALAFLDWFEWLGNRALRLPPGSRAVETGGYKGTRRVLAKSALYARFTEKLGLATDDVFNEYGMTELSSQFYARGVDGVHHGSRWVRAMVVDPDTQREVADGATGLLRLFDLANVGSCCALQTRDLAVRCGDDFRLIGRDPASLPRGCSRTADEMLSQR